MRGCAVFTPPSDADRPSTAHQQPMRQAISENRKTRRICSPKQDCAPSLTRQPCSGPIALPLEIQYTDSMASFFIENFGCRAARADGEAIGARLRSSGLDEKTVHDAALVLVNTCSVTA